MKWIEYEYDCILAPFLPIAPMLYLNTTHTHLVPLLCHCPASLLALLALLPPLFSSLSLSPSLSLSLLIILIPIPLPLSLSLSLMNKDRVSSSSSSSSY
jgi:hypothetical protein